MKKLLVIILLVLIGSFPYYFYNSYKMSNYIKINNTYYKKDTELLDLSNNEELDLNNMLLFEDLKELSLENTTISFTDALSLKKKYPDLKIITGKVKVFDDYIYDVNEEKIILNDHKIDNADDFIIFFKLFNNIKVIEMCDTGISNE